MTDVSFRIPSIRLRNIANVRWHWSQRARHAAAQRTAARAFATRALAGIAPVGDIVVTIVRVAPRAMDSDGATIAAKHVRDGIADALRLDDGDRRLTWHVAQRKGEPREYAVEVTVTLAAGKQTDCCGRARETRTEQGETCQDILPSGTDD